MTQSNSQKAAEQFVEKWPKVELSERAASHEHFIDLCRMIDEPAPGADEQVAAERARVDQLVLGNLLKMNQERATAPDSAQQ